MHVRHDNATTAVLHDKGEMYICEKGGRVTGWERARVITQSSGTDVLSALSSLGSTSTSV